MECLVLRHSFAWNMKELFKVQCGSHLIFFWFHFGRRTGSFLLICPKIANFQPWAAATLSHGVAKGKIGEFKQRSLFQLNICVYSATSSLQYDFQALDELLSMSMIEWIRAKLLSAFIATKFPREVEATAAAVIDHSFWRKMQKLELKIF